MMILELHLQLFVIAVGQVTADAQNQFVVVEFGQVVHEGPRAIDRCGCAMISRHRVILMTLRRQSLA